jgi:hypothetical protein
MHAVSSRCADQVEDLVAFFASFPSALLSHGNRASARAACERTSICACGRPCLESASPETAMCCARAVVRAAGSTPATTARGCEIRPAVVRTCAPTLAAFTRDTSRPPGSLRPAPGVRSCREHQAADDDNWILVTRRNAIIHESFRVISIMNYCISPDETLENGIQKSRFCFTTGRCV